MARWYTYQTLDPLDPTSGRKTEVRLAGDYLDRLSKSRPVDYCNLRTVVAVLNDPYRIFYGLRQLTEGGWCYVGKPEEWWIRDNVVTPFPRDMVYAVYLRNDLIVYSFKAEYADEKDDYSPRGWDERYQKLVWKRKT